MKRYTLKSWDDKGRPRTRAFNTREGRDQALLAAYCLFHRHNGVTSAAIADPDGYRVEEKS